MSGCRLRQSVTRSDPYISAPAEYFAAGKELEFLGIHWVCFNLHSELPSQTQDPL